MTAVTSALGDAVIDAIAYGGCGDERGCHQQLG
jgi:hypothetical protein